MAWGGRSSIARGQISKLSQWHFGIVYFEIVGHLLMPTMGFKNSFPPPGLQCQAGNLPQGRARMQARSHLLVTGRGGVLVNPFCGLAGKRWPQSQHVAGAMGAWWWLMWTPMRRFWLHPIVGLQWYTDWATTTSSSQGQLIQKRILQYK